MKKYNFELERGLLKHKSETTTVKNAVSDLLDFYKLKKKFSEIDATHAWEKVMGTSVAKRTKELSVKDGKMYVKLESASLKNELMMAKTTIIEKLNQVSGEGTLQDLIFN